MGRTGKKSPDNSFRPGRIEGPPGTPLPGSIRAYPTFTVEDAKLHETFPDFIEDASETYFASMTGAMLYLGINIFPDRRMIKVILGERTI
jgi:hypothetical protein